MCVISIAMVRHTMSCDDRAKGLGVEREEERTKDRALWDSGDEGVWRRYFTSPGYLEGAI